MSFALDIYAPEKRVKVEDALLRISMDKVNTNKSFQLKSVAEYSNKLILSLHLKIHQICFKRRRGKSE